MRRNANMSKSRVLVTAALLLIFGVSVGIVASGLMNSAGAQDDLEGRRALLQRDDSVPPPPGQMPPVSGISGIAANEKYVFVFQGGMVQQLDAESLELVKHVQVGYGLTGGPKPMYATPVSKIRVEAPVKPESGNLERGGDKKTGNDKGGEGETE
jgi:hypothetical protein